MLNIQVVDERQIEYRARTWSDIEMLAVIRNGELTEFTELTGSFVNGNIDDVIEFLQAIKKAKEETK